MSNYISKESKLESYMFTFLIVPAMILLFVALTQPAWRGKQMIAEIQSDCKKQGGVMLEHKNALGSTYKCAPRLDKVQL